MNSNPGTSILHVLEEFCVCGCPTVSCPTCGDIRCLHCDPLCDSDASCHEGSAEEAGGECRCEQIRTAYHGKPGSAGAAARAGVSTVCAVHGDLALSEGSADRGSEEGGER